MRIGISTGYRENYWGDWFTARQLGGSERIALILSREFARIGHDTTLRLPYRSADFVQDGVRHIGTSAAGEQYDLLLALDDFARQDSADRIVLVAARSDPPPHTDFDQMIFLSKHHARLMGHPDRPAIGGGVDLDAYRTHFPRIPRRVLCTSSPDRCASAAAIGRAFDFVHTYKPVPGYATVEVPRDELVRLQQTAQVLIYPLNPRRPSDFFSMAVLEAMAAGTPVVVSDADSMNELWSDAAVVVHLPIRLGQWVEEIERLLSSEKRWQRYSELGKQKAKHYAWPVVARKYLEVALDGNI